MGRTRPSVEQLVERRHGRGVVRAGRGGGEVGLERVARDGRAAQHAAGVGGQQRRAPRPSEAITAAGTPTASSAAPASGDRPAPPAPCGARELLEVERVAARLLVERVRPLAPDVVAEQLAGRLAREAAELEASEAAWRSARSSAVARRSGY